MGLKRKGEPILTFVPWTSHWAICVSVDRCAWRNHDPQITAPAPETARQDPDAGSPRLAWHLRLCRATLLQNRGDSARSAFPGSAKGVGCTTRSDSRLRRKEWQCGRLDRTSGS